MDDETKPKANTPWYRRGTSLILTVGALAAAAASVVGLWDRFKPGDTKDVATVEVTEEGRSLALRDFMTENLGDYVTLVRDSEGAAAHHIRINGATEASLAVVPSLPPTPALPGISPVPPEPAVPTGSSDTGTGGSSGPSESATESTDPESPSTSPPGTVTDVVLENTARDVGGILFNDPGYFEPSDMKIFLQAAPAQDAPPADPAAQEFFEDAAAQTTSEDAAPQIIEALNVVEGTYDASPEPRGWVIPVNLSFEKLSGEKLSLTWSLEGIDVPQSWSGDKLAYRVQAKTDQASSSTEEIWVPDLTVPGTYQLTVKLVKETDRDFVVAEDSSGLLNQ
ncbi:MULTISPECIES: hypothetical protein [unclassified Arthrobacter]|uniref:hypothetical protein n=1 Tax=unclassified Arthrobacter TaxID=235627 RepID=UPI000CE490F8|nr:MULTISPECIES: hypothetical protein [unclassified Arthrobacter]